jgi:hypothetical protein
MHHQFIRVRTLGVKGHTGTFPIDGVPECDCGDNQVQTSGAVSLNLE